MRLDAFSEFSRDGQDWTGAFAVAVADLAAQGGGELLVPAGTYETGPIELGSDMTLRLEAGAVLRFIGDSDVYPLIDGEFEGIPGIMHKSCIYARGARNVRVCGDGTIDGNGAAWWRAKRDGTLAYPRPFLVHFVDCDRVTVEGVRLINSPCWTVHPLYCRDVAVRGVHIENPADSPNTDGINPGSCNHVRITDCYIDVGDDCIAIKSGTEDTPRRQPCENIIVANCSMAHGHGGVVIGSEMSGGVRNVLVTGCVMQDTDRGIRIKTRRGRGGAVENLQVIGVLMDGVACPFVVNMYYFCGKDGRTERVRDKSVLPVDEGTPVIRDISLSGIRVRGATACAGYLHGLPEAPIERVTLRDCTVEMVPGKPDVPAMLDDVPVMEAEGFFLRGIDGLTMENVQVVGARGEAFDRDESVR